MSFFEVLCLGAAYLAGQHNGQRQAEKRLVEDMDKKRLMEEVWFLRSEVRRLKEQTLIECDRD